MLICYKQTEEKEDTEKERGDTMAENNTKELDFDRKHEEDLQRLRGLRLLDDDFMQKVFEDKACNRVFASDYFKSYRFESIASERTAGY